MKLKKMRTVKECAIEIKTVDPDSAITEWFIRCLCKDNKIQHFMAGNKVLVNFDDLISYLNFEKVEV